MRYFNYGRDLVDHSRGDLVISAGEHVSSHVTKELDRLADAKEAAEARAQAAEARLARIAAVTGLGGHAVASQVALVNLLGRIYALTDVEKQAGMRLYVKLSAMPNRVGIRSFFAKDDADAVTQAALVDLKTTEYRIATDAGEIINPFDK